MAKKPNTVGGGSKTNLNGLAFEERTNLLESLNNHDDFTVLGNKVFKDGEIVALYFEKYKLYSQFLKPNGVDFTKVISKQLLPDGALLIGDTIYIIEKKYQDKNGSVDEKLQTCDFKKKQYEKLFNPLGIKVEYYYVLSNWFNQPKNNDVFEYIKSVGCDYFFEFLPLEKLKLY